MKTLILTALLGIVSMLSEIFGFRKYLWTILVLGLTGVFCVNLSELTSAYQYFPNMVVFDHYAGVFSGLIILMALVWFFISKDQYDSNEFNQADHYSLIMFALTGTIVLVSFTHLAMLFLGIEILSIPMFILAGSRKHELSSNEASLKYFIMGAFASGILLFGIALLYGATGTFNIHEIALIASNNSGSVSILFYTGIFMVMIGLAFKVSAVPFHFWTPDVYEGSPLVITAFMATIVKTAAFAAFYRLFNTTFAPLIHQWGSTLSVIIIFTILTGNILAVYQTSVKRMLAYSGIAQAGYMLMTILLTTYESQNALILYTSSYALSTLCAFAVLHYVVKIKGSDTFESFSGLGKSHPLLAVIMVISMLSLAGIPPAVGFFAKFYLFSAVLQQGYLALVIVAVLGSLISVYYYFRVIISMYSGESETESIQLTVINKAVLVLIGCLIILLGVTPGLFIDAIKSLT
ncbi:MAG: NADH-quinone oxidoreductase subunit N [Sporocytophaga sp.]|uniref:NADH-quinone oxidoreductase subunit N n=1 Tax=Sporocytophaga sp. TaxID=2231183 RepID=UPI001B1F21FF|nr:NADH-quinone oxidoreductase subunit N [Sporocytophaga sp.]MBO9700707.1 NADH-quinone oxidoreductase subunit N [Sporocytophaga sp.]